MKKYKYHGAITIDGHQYRIHADTKVELEAKKALKRREVLEGRAVMPGSGDMTVSVWAMRCIDLYKLRMSDVTKEKYIRKLNARILPAIGQKKLRKVTALDCQLIMNSLDGMSAAYARDISQMLRFIFGKAVQNRMIASDPTEGMTAPKSKPTEHRRALTPEERAAVLKIGATSRRYYIWLLILLCGCRPAEASECKGSDIIRVDGVNMLHIRGSKNRFSDRCVPIPDALYDLIKDIPQNEYIACTQAGNKIDANRQRTWSSFKYYLDIELGAKLYRNAVTESRIASDLFPYCLRHEYCTNLARMGIDIRIAQRLMGHSDIRMTANIYTNLEATDMAAVANILK